MTTPHNLCRVLACIAIVFLGTIPSVVRSQDDDAPPPGERPVEKPIEKPLERPDPAALNAASNQTSWSWRDSGTGVGLGVGVAGTGSVNEQGGGCR